ncbi:MAG: hypothetical protein RL026_2175 [Pseudomonadota bacterium]|jgi:hypothetical protein
MSLFEGVDTVVLYDELAYEDALPVAWSPLERPPDAAASAALTERNLKALHAFTALEELGAADKHEDKAGCAGDIIRLEMKINIALELLGQLLVASKPRPTLTAVRFNALGMVWRSSVPHPVPNTHGLVEIYLKDSIAQPLGFIAYIRSVSADGVVKARFAPPGEPVSDLIEKLAFRRHRRQVAGARQPRRG